MRLCAGWVVHKHASLLLLGRDARWRFTITQSDIPTSPWSIGAWASKCPKTPKAAQRLRVRIRFNYLVARSCFCEHPSVHFSDVSRLAATSRDIWCMDGEMDVPFLHPRFSPNFFHAIFPNNSEETSGGTSSGRYPTKTVRHGTIWPMSAPSWPGSAPGCRCQATIVCHTSHRDFFERHDMDLTFAHNRCCKVWHVSKGFGATQAFDPSGTESYFVVSRMQQVNGSTSGAGFGVIKFLPDAAALDFCPSVWTA